MVRTLVGTMIRVGLGRLPVEGVREILVSGDRRRAGPAVPPHGLCLMAVRYAESQESGVKNWQFYDSPDSVIL
jgi:tRNA pseudouridine38-40 synthase